MLSKTDYYFLVIAKTGNLNQAAQQLYVSQPSLSKYIQRLETQLGTSLFDRSSSPMRLNESGKIYLQYLRNAIEKEQELLCQIGEINQMIRGTLRLGIPSFCGQCYLPKVLPAFSREFPHVSLELYEKTGVKIEQALLDQEIDLAILHPPVIHENLTRRIIAKERILLVTQKTPEDDETDFTRQAAVREGTFPDIAGKPVIMPQADQKLSRIVNRFFSLLDYQPHIYTRTENVVTTMELAALGMGIGFTPESGLNTVSENILNRLRFFSFSDSLSDWQLAAVVRRDTAMSVFSKRFVELISESARQTGRSMQQKE